MFIWKETGLRGPAYPDSTPYAAPDGTQYPRTPRELLQEISDPQCPADKLDEFTAHPDWYFVQEQDPAPYCQWIRKPAEMIAQIEQGKVDAKLVLVRQVREGILNRLAGIAFAAQLSGDTATTTAYLVVRTALLGITDGLKDLAPELVEPTVVQRYALLRESCTPAMVSAFAQVDA